MVPVPESKAKQASGAGAAWAELVNTTVVAKMATIPAISVCFM